LENIKPKFRLGMTAPEVVVEIVRINPDITAVFFKTYTSTKNLEEEPVIQIRTSIDRMIQHSPNPKESFWLIRKEITLNQLNAIVEGLSQERALAVTSKVRLVYPRTISHIPMMDFNCVTSSVNLEKVQEFLRKIGQEGVVLATGRSYHFYGIRPMTENKWYEFLGRCLLFSDFTDSRYVGHRLIDGFTDLRISREIRRPQSPRVVAIL